MKKAEVSSLWNQRNAARALNNRRRWRAESREMRAAQGAVYRARYPEKNRAKLARWKEANPDRVRAQKVMQRRRKMARRNRAEVMALQMMENESNASE
jgi:hypothetical protein